MITIKPASELEIGDVFSTDGFAVERLVTLADGRISVSLWLNASGGIQKHAVVAPDFECPIWTPDVDTSKLLWERGNLYTGYPWGVEAVKPFGSSELYGPFSGENEANTFAHKLAAGALAPGYDAVKVVRLETPQHGRAIVRAKDGVGVNGTGLEYEPSRESTLEELRAIERAAESD